MVRYLTTNGKSYGYGASNPFALRYPRAKGTFYEAIIIKGLIIVWTRINPLTPTLSPKTGERAG
jgi:hypothetical protein